jgi:3-oxoisoapionate decarboxylase
MRLGLSSYTFTWAVGVPGHTPRHRLSAFGLVDLTSSFGLKCVQIADNLPLDRLTSAEAAALRARAAERGVAIEVGARGLTPDRLAAHVDLAAFYGSPLLRFVIDGPGYEPSLDEAVAVVRGGLPRLREAGVRLAIENHDRLEARAFREIVQATDDRQVGICLDSVNSMGAGEGLAEAVATLAPLTINLHLKDFTIERVSHKMGFVVEGTPAGRGRLRIPWLLEEVRRHGRCESAILELWTPPADSIEATTEKEARWAEESVQFLKPFFA